MIIPDSMLTKSIHFPVIRAIPDLPTKGLWARFKKFMTYRRKWEIMEDYVIWSECLQAFIFMPKGFIFDGASVPKALHSVLGPTGVLLLGAGPHDLGYRYHGLVLVDPDTGKLFFRPYNKRDLDEVFRSLCEVESSLKMSTRGAKWALLGFGSGSWNNKEYQTLSLSDDFPGIFNGDTENGYC